MERIKIIVQDKRYETYKSTLENIVWFKNYFKDNKDTNIINLNMTNYDFETLLDYARNPYNSTEINDIIERLNESNIIKLNIGGEKFLVYENILMKMDYFKSLLTNWSSKDIFIDQNPKYFQIILDYLEHNINIPKEFLNKPSFINVLTYFGVSYHSNIDKESNTKIKQKIIKNQFNKSHVYINGNPQITYFKTVHRRNTWFDFNYDYYDPKINLNELNAYKEQTIDLYKTVTQLNYHLIANMYFILEFEIDYDTNYNVKWIDNVEDYIFEYIDLEFNSQTKLHYDSDSIHIHNKSKKSCDIDYAPADNIGTTSSQSFDGDTIQSNTINNIRKLIIPFNIFMMRYNPIPIFILMHIQSSMMFKLRNLLDLVSVNCDKSLYSTVIKSFKVSKLDLVIKTITLDTDEKNRFLHIGHEYLVLLYFSREIKLDKTELKYRVSNIKSSMINYIFLLFKTKDKFSINAEPCFSDLEILIDNKTYLHIDADLMKAINKFEQEKSLSVPNVYSYNLGYNIIDSTTKGISLINEFDLIITMKPGFTSDSLSIVFREEDVMRVYNGLLSFNNRT